MRSYRTSTFFTAAAAALLFPALDRLHAASMTHGPQSAAVTPTSATIWVRTDTGTTPPNGGVRVYYRPVGNPSWQQTAMFQTAGGTDNTVAIPLSGLTSSTAYEYVVHVDGSPQMATTAKFKTFPPSNAAAPPFKFGLLADLNLVDNASVLTALAQENPAFVVVLGDYDHRDPGSSTDVLGAARAMHRQTRQLSPAPSYCTPNCPGDEIREFLLKAPVAAVWDDHDYCCNNAHADSTFGSATGKADTFQAHKEYWPSYPLANAPNGLWHKFNYGSEVEVYVLDLRFQRNNFTASDNCSDEQVKSMLSKDTAISGTLQKAWLKSSLLASQAKWKFIISSVPWNRTLPKGDAWYTFQCEQNELLSFFDSSDISGVVFVSGDIHSGGAIDDGTNAKCPELSVPNTNEITIRCGGPGGLQCGDWKCSQGSGNCFREFGIGYGIIEVDSGANTATLRTKAWDGGNARHLTHILSEGTACTAPAP